MNTVERNFSIGASISWRTEMKSEIASFRSKLDDRLIGDAENVNHSYGSNVSNLLENDNPSPHAFRNKGGCLYRP